MTIFVGNREIKRIYIGGQGYIKKAYYGRKLVYEIQSLFESGVAGTYTLFVDSDEVYEIAICGAGGGGGGSATSHSWMGDTGGSGAAFLGNVVLTRGTYTLIIGAGGAGGPSSGSNAGYGGTGGLSRITDENGNVLITAGAGTGGSGTNDGGIVGQGGVLTMGTAQVISYTIQSNGVAGSTASILGNGYGAAGYPVYHSNGTSGTNGYIRIKYVEPVPNNYT